MSHNLPAGKDLAVTVGFSVLGASLMVWGAYLSYDDMESKQARVKARTDAIRKLLKRKYGYEGGKLLSEPQHPPPPPPPPRPFTVNFFPNQPK